MKRKQPSSITAQIKLIRRRMLLARKDQGMTQVEAAKAAGIPQPSLWQIEEGNTAPSLPTLLKYAKAMDVSVAWLVGEEK